MRIYLVGMPGSGKSTLGKQLADKLSYNFVDLDSLIVEKEQSTISDIFENKGEDYFRKVEQEALHSTENLENTVIATGGGTPCFFDNMDWINNHGQSIYINVLLEEIEKRLDKDTSRPLLNKTSLKELFEKREQFYLMAERVIEGIEDY